MPNIDKQTQRFDDYCDCELSEENDLLDLSYSTTDGCHDSSKNTSKSNESADEVDDVNFRLRRRPNFSPTSRERKHHSPSPFNRHQDFKLPTSLIDHPPQPGVKRKLQIFQSHKNKNGDTTRTKILLEESPISLKKQSTNKEDKGMFQNVSKFLIISVFLLAIIGLYRYVSASNTNNDLITVNNRKLCNVTRLQLLFPNQNKYLWNAIKIGIETTINDDPTKPSVYLFVYNDGKTVKRFMEQIIYLTRNCMESNSDPVVLSKNELSGAEMENDYGIAIAEYKQKLSNSQVLLVNDLDQVPASVAQAFHFICDTESPLVQRLIVYTTIYINTFNRNRQLLLNVENNLKSNWSSLKPNIVEPLVARLTDQVLFLAPEEN